MGNPTPNVPWGAFGTRFSMDTGVETGTPNKILVPVDFTAASIAALDWALMLRRTTGAHVELLHVWHAPHYLAPDLMLLPREGADAMTIADYVRRRAGQRMEEILDTLLQRGIRDVRARIEAGDPAPKIVEVAERGRFDLVVMGTHGRTGVSHFFEGSVAENVVRHASCPVVTIRVTEESAQLSLPEEGPRP